MFSLKKINIVFLLLYVILNTFLSFSIIYIINNVLSGNEAFLQDYMIIVFFALTIYCYLLNIISQKKLSQYTYKILYENEKKLFQQVLEAPLKSLEKFGSERFYTVIEDLRFFSALPYTVTNTLSSVLTLILCMVYMFTLSVLSAFIVLVLTLLVAVCYYIVTNSIAKQISTLRNYDENYYKYIKDLILGFKELKLSAIRRKNIMEKYLTPNRNQSEVLAYKINYISLSISLISQYGLYFIIAVILFVLPALGLMLREDVITYIVLILFISGPINNLFNLQETYTRLIVASKRIKDFKKDFKFISKKDNFTHEFLPPFNSLRFKDISFKYNKEKESFALGPINLEIKKGEVIFVIGGNGSGKSTFINILTGLYEPYSGNVFVNKKVGTIKDDLQQSIAAIFTDNYIFSNNYENDEIKNNKEYKQLLVAMKLNQVISDDEDSSIRRKYSKGQSKRLSLILALLEHKPILVLDEWAADQDPQFRRLFYEEVIPKLKKAGKTIIAVTHDDAYFHQADRVIKFDYGQIIKDITLPTKEKVKPSLWL